jgi:hypothetical protein
MFFVTWWIISHDFGESQLDSSGYKPWSCFSRLVIQLGCYWLINIYLVCFDHLENSQWEGLSHILWKIKNVPNHQPAIYIYVTGFFIIFMNQLFNDGWFICPNMDSVNELNVCKALGRPTSLKLAWICLRSPKPTSCYRGNITAIRHSNQLSSCIFHRRNKHNAPTHTKHDKTLSDYMITLNPISVFNWLSEGLTIPGPMKKNIHVIVLSPNIHRVSSWASEQSQYTRWSNHTFGQTISSIWMKPKKSWWLIIIDQQKVGGLF